MRAIADTATVSARARDIIALAKSIEQADGCHILSASIGIALIPQYGATYKEAFAAADNALYEVKRSRRGTYRFAGDRGDTGGTGDTTSGTSNTSNTSDN